MNLDDDDEFLKEFINEANSDLDLIDNSLVELEQDPTNKELIGQVFRSLHSMKGAAGMFEYARLEKVAHISENLLDLIREDKIKVTEDIITALLDAIDIIKAIVNHIATNGNENEGDDTTLLARLEALCDPENQASLPDNNSVADEKTAATTPPTETTEPVVAVETSIRIDIALLDKLMDLVGELVLARNQYLTYMDKQNDQEFTQLCQNMNLVTSDLQDNVMKARMQSIATLWDKYPRIIRDLAKSCNKKVNLVMEGKDTALDKSLLEAIRDPFTHLLRNAVDHGIELPEVREQAGKEPAGTLRLNACQANGQVVIDIIDDGGGIDPSRIAAKAVEKGLLTTDAAAKMSDNEKLQLIMMAGFSTAESISNISGRGVGMDVVKSNIQKIGGSIEIASELSKGSHFKLSIPLTLAIIPALIVNSGGINFAMPQEALVEMVCIKTSQIEEFHNIKTFRLRGSLVPLVSLRDVLEIPNCLEYDHYMKSNKIKVIIIKVQETVFGCIVDSVDETQEIVVKPLSPQIKHLRVYSGVTILGSGDVTLILDPVGLSDRINLSDMKNINIEMDETEDESRDNSDYMLLVAADKDNYICFPLDNIERLIKIKRSDIESTGDIMVTQYDDECLPVTSLSSIINQRDLELSDDINLFIYKNGNSRSGIIVERIIDTVFADAASLDTPTRGVMSGNMIINNHITEVVDTAKFEGLMKDHCNFLPGSEVRK